MMDAQKLKDFQPGKEYFIGLDSDGCVFDSMEIKHKECFCPAFINYFGLQAIAKYAREAWEFVNLYSTTRGANRFVVVIRSLDLLAERPEVKARGVRIPAMDGLRDWLERETKLGNPALEAEVKRTNDPDLKTALEWSKEVNATIEKMVHDVPPFPLVRESLVKMTEKADVIVVSQTPTEALEREWREHAIDKYVHLIAGQELGTKTEHIQFVARGKYAPEKILMVGDAPGDCKAAQGNDALFYPINPGYEEASWQRFFEEALDRFFAGTYAGEYEQQLVAEFNKYLPEKAHWQQ
jgi:phosphoglycolate phosphatase-like HAD superfamily hydrolase